MIIVCCNCIIIRIWIRATRIWMTVHLESSCLQHICVPMTFCFNLLMGKVYNSATIPSHALIISFFLKWIDTYLFVNKISVYDKPFLLRAYCLFALGVIPVHRRQNIQGLRVFISLQLRYNISSVSNAHNELLTLVYLGNWKAIENCPSNTKRRFVKLSTHCPETNHKINISSNWKVA